MSLQKQIDDLIAQRASQWLDVLRKGNAEDLAAFVTWAGESPRNLDEFLTAAALDRELESKDLYAQIDRKALLERIGPAPVAQLKHPRRPSMEKAEHSSRINRWKIGALAAGIAVVALLAYWGHQALAPAQKFTTGVGELRSLELPDGSLVYLNARSLMRLRFDEVARRIELEQGEALFKVARDTQRPFEVRTRDAAVKALGTQFNVSSRASGTQVSVLEGRVQVAPLAGAAGKATDLAVGEAAQIPRKGGVQVTSHADVTSAVAWRDRRLVFRMAPLEDIVEEFNRFNRKRLRLEGVQATTRHYSGTFDADDPQALIAFLARERDLTVEEEAQEIVIRGRQEHGLQR